jgi:ABC-2 type transport system permease protein
VSAVDRAGTIGEARIHDRGYRRYDGPRTGELGAIRALTAHSIQRGLGLRRTLWAKVLPIVTVAIAYVPAVVFVGMVAFIPVEDLPYGFLPTYGDYYRWVIAAIMVFVALAAPEILCTDRRTGMLGVYLSSPLNRTTYLLAKAAAVAFVLSLVCLGPPLLMLVANVLQNEGPEGTTAILTTLGRVLAAGVALTLLYTGVTMGIASLTDRKAVASAGIILVFLVSLTVTSTLVETGTPEGVSAWSVTLLSMDLASRIHGETSWVMPTAPTGIAWLSWFLWTAGGFAVAWLRLHRLPVTR